MLIRSIKKNPSEYQVVAVVDDDRNKKHLKIMDVNVYGTTKEIPRIVQEKKLMKLF